MSKQIFHIHTLSASSVSKMALLH